MVRDQAAADDVKLIKACQRGDTLASVQLVDLYWDRVYAFSYRLTMNRTDAEDIAQETFLRAFSKLKDFQPTGPFKAWLLRIATNLFLDSQKSSQKKSIPTDDMQVYPQRENSAEKALENRELLGAINDAMQNLSKEQRTVLLLRAGEHLEYSEIASMLQVKEATVRLTSDNHSSRRRQL